ncbi:HGG motif-containing thioesterase [Halalkaliarchaeum sp. AArc-CO]|uniref:PaaI family thioesterase n=1 Tax=unclassified Halalkaliarchaeum TaxID=2678344 RepID=UPI00217EEB32|nr:MULTISPECIES: PaaI family thioesterase [unclassified Halalkaliarchaeum]MDR5672148.1 PaaI family thioesterase [Halalkaliarchaeum sp. AArc-GB]UWG51653.1 HGG motif-containing thioesterase [Halalkaliarchaeum sp. AArc-CO]
MDEEIDERPPLPEEATAVLEHAIEKEHGYLSWLGTEVTAVERGKIVLTVPYDEKLTNSDGETVHGGVAATLIDTAGGIAQQTCLEDPLSSSAATVNLNVNYLRRATGDLRAVGEVIRHGGTIGVSDLRVESSTPDGDIREVVVGQGSYRLFR